MADERDADGFCDQAVRLGLLRESLAERARAAYRDAAISMPFDEFLVDQGLLSPEQRLTLLNPEEEPQEDGPKPGDRHSGCVIERKLGAGGMGTVYVARRESDGQLVVLKFLTANLCTNESLFRRFQREGNILTKLRPNPHLVQVYDVDPSGPRPHIVMELVEGKALDQRLKDEFSLPPLEAASIAKDVALGLAEIHRAGIIHRDVKPSNVLLATGADGRPVAKIIDFGLAKDLRADDGISKPGVRLGTPYYMAPEQWGNHVVDARCDLFALGATLYTLIVGEPPFLGKDTSEVARRALRGTYTPPEVIARDTPPELSLVIAQLLQVERGHRYADAERVARDLQRVLDGQEVLVPRLLERRGDVVKRHPLVPGTIFSIGRADTCRIQLRHPSVSGDHASLRRDAHGFILSDQGSTYGTFVNDAPIAREVALRHGDVVRLGKVTLELKDEAAATGPARPKTHVSKHPEIAFEVCEPIIEALAESGDRRVALHLIDLIAAARTDDAEREALRAIVGDGPLDRVLQGVQARRGEQRAWAAARLRAIAGQDHGTDVAAWLAWWDEMRADLPPQAAVRELRPAWGVQVEHGLPGNPTVWLPPDAVLSIGREEGCGLRLTHQSVSRLHATLFRFPRRLALRDEGSRFGTLVNGVKTPRALLSAGDKVEVGTVTLTLLRRDPGPVRSTLGTTLIDARWFDALEAVEHPAVTLGLARLLHQATRLEWIDPELAPLFPDGAPTALVERVARAYRARAERARNLLPRALGLPPGDVSAWRQALAQRRASLPPQVMPAGWFPEGPEPSPPTATRVPL
jgi:serine/threonine protein kinase